MADFVVPSQRQRMVQYLLELERDVEENDVAIMQQLSNHKNTMYNSKEEKILGQATAVEKTCTWTV